MPTGGQSVLCYAAIFIIQDEMYSLLPRVGLGDLADLIPSPVITEHPQLPSLILHFKLPAVERYGVTILCLEVLYKLIEALGVYHNVHYFHFHFLLCSLHLMYIL